MMIRAREYRDARQLQADAAALRRKMFGAPSFEQRREEEQVREAARRAQEDLQAAEEQEKAALRARVQTALEGGGTAAQDLGGLRETKEPRRIIAAIARLHGLALEDLLGRGRSHDIQLAVRCAITVLKRVNPQMSTTVIGKHLGGRDHSTIVHHIQAIEAEQPWMPPLPRPEMGRPRKAVPPTAEAPAP